MEVALRQQGEKVIQNNLRLLVHVEGQTEESFVNEILAPHLYDNFGYSSVSARLLGNARQRNRRGGITNWPAARRDIVHHLLQDKGCFATIMVDYYGLPMSGNGAWPGRATASSSPFTMKAKIVEDCISNDVCSQMGSDFNKNRFVPYLMMHEFEALLFSDCTKFCDAIGRPDLIGNFQSIRDQFVNPEEIDDTPNQAPSKRILELVEGYQKPHFGTLGVIEIGLNQIRKECPNFSEWMNKLESF